MSGPLVTGQTSISSSLVSMESFKNEFDKRGLDSRAHRQAPEPLVGECDAFYRVLFRHHDRTRVRERDIVARIQMVVGKGVALRFDAEFLNQRKEALRMCDARDRVHTARRPAIERRRKPRVD